MERCSWANSNTRWTTRTVSRCRRSSGRRWREASCSTRGLDACVEAYPAADWEALVESRLAGLNPLSKEARTLGRFYYTGAVEAMPDKQGRVMVPTALVEHGGLGREVVVLGMRDRLEIWNRADWRAQLKEVMGSAEDVAERLAAQHD